MLDAPLPERNRFVTGPGPASGGSKPGKDTRAQRPEKSGVDAAPCGPPLAWPAVCPKAGTAAANAVMADKTAMLRKCMAFLPCALRKCPPFGARAPIRLSLVVLDARVVPFGKQNGSLSARLLNTMRPQITASREGIPKMCQRTASGFSRWIGES